MTALTQMLGAAVAISLAVIVVGVCAQGRLKHWILVALGAVPRTSLPTPFGEIPRSERDWTMLAPLKGMDARKR
ncbi:MAG: hypothetical protein JW722_00440 [Demequinaceae bacterium]|nr:hypothetical protein [Demequinaceae bacterium]